MTSAFDPIALGPLHLRNRIVMAPMTRNRADEPGAVPSARMATYYGQRATAGLIVTEGMHPHEGGQSYPHEPGLHSADQVQGWRRVTDAVHQHGGAIFAQLMHGGRISHPDTLPGERYPLAPSAVAAPGSTFTPSGPQEFVAPREMTEDDIEEALASYGSAARNAIEAGFDGVEIHGANGYLPHQFLSANVNLRTDRWGGSVENRIRFVVEAARRAVEAIGPERVGIRLSPGGTANGIEDHPDLIATYVPLVRALAELGLVYVHIAENPEHTALTDHLRKEWNGVFVLAPTIGATPSGPDDLAVVGKRADMVALGRMFIANADLVARLAAGGPFNAPDTATFYGGGETGYTDYPAL